MCIKVKIIFLAWSWGGIQIQHCGFIYDISALFCCRPCVLWGMCLLKATMGILCLIIKLETSFEVSSCRSCQESVCPRFELSVILSFPVLFLQLLSRTLTVTTRSWPCPFTAQLFHPTFPVPNWVWSPLMTSHCIISKDVLFGCTCWCRVSEEHPLNSSVGFLI